MKRDELQFNEDAHTYQYKGKQLSGITGAVSRRLGKDFSKAGDFVEPFMEFGKLIHKEVQDYINEGILPSRRESKYVIQYLQRVFPKGEYFLMGEVLVSNYETHASAIDIFVYTKDNKAILIDIKTGNFDREYCSWQLGIYKMLTEIEGEFEVLSCIVLATKDSIAYSVTPKSKERCEALLKGETNGQGKRSKR